MAVWALGDFRRLIAASCPVSASRGVRICLNPGLRWPTHPVHLVGSLTLPRPPIALLNVGAGISNLLSIAYACNGLGLGPD